MGSGATSARAACWRRRRAAPTAWASSRPSCSPSSRSAASSTSATASWPAAPAGRTTARWAAPTSTSTTRPTATSPPRRSSATCPAGSCSTSRPSSWAARAARPGRCGWVSGRSWPPAASCASDILEDGQAGVVAAAGGASAPHTRARTAIWPGGAQQRASTSRTWWPSRSGTARCGSRSSPVRSWGRGLRGALGVLAGAKEERISRWLAMAAKVPAGQAGAQGVARQRSGELCALFTTAELPAHGTEEERFLAGLSSATDASRGLHGDHPEPYAGFIARQGYSGCSESWTRSAGRAERCCLPWAAFRAR